MNQPDDPQLQVVAPFWLDRPDLEVVEIATNAAELGYGGMWLGEMATFDAFALATAVGLRAPGLHLTIGPLAVGVRSPVALALGLSSVAQLTDARADLALGASSPAIVAGWHDRDWARPAERMSEMLDSLRPILDGERSAFEGRLIKTAGFRLRHSLPEAQISVAAFGPLMTRVAARQGRCRRAESRRAGNRQALARSRWRGSRESWPPGASPRGLDSRGTRAGRRGTRATGSADRHLPRAPRIRRDVHCARLRRSRSPSQKRRAPGELGGRRAA